MKAEGDKPTVVLDGPPSDEEMAMLPPDTYAYIKSLELALELKDADIERAVRIARTYADNTTCTRSKAVALKIAEDIEGLG